MKNTDGFTKSNICHFCKELLQTTNELYIRCDNCNIEYFERGLSGIVDIVFDIDINDKNYEVYYYEKYVSIWLTGKIWNHIVDINIPKGLTPQVIRNKLPLWLLLI
jgi:hypothetical protein